MSTSLSSYSGNQHVKLRPRSEYLTLHSAPAMNLPENFVSSQGISQERQWGAG